MLTKFDLQTSFDYAIIGGGCMGVSTALALQRESPNAKIILFEGLETKTASKGICKIIRTPYIDEDYVLLAKEAKKKWETEAPYCDFYHRTGWIQVVRRGGYVPFHSEERTITAEELSSPVCSLHEVDIEEECWLNEDIGVADSALALEAVAAEAATQGVMRRKINVSKLLVENGFCYGVKCTDGESIRAETTIVATGSWTPALLESSNVQLPYIGFFNVTATGVATTPLNDQEYAQFKSMPILVTDQGISSLSTGIHLSDVL